MPSTCSLTSWGCDQAKGVTRQILRPIGLAKPSRAEARRLAPDCDRLPAAGTHRARGEDMESLERAWRKLVFAVFAAALFAVVVVSTAGAAAGPDPLRKINHIVVIYEENHSFDNLYGGWEGVNGRANADPAHTRQVDQNGATYTCLLQNDVNLVNLTATCNDAAHGFSTAFPNTWWMIDPLIPPSATTCPTVLGAFAFPFGVPNGTGLPGGCTRDLVHKFYQEQYQLDGGHQDRYATGTDSAGVSMGVYD